MVNCVIVSQAAHPHQERGLIVQEIPHSTHVALLLLCFFLHIIPLHARIIHVPADSTTILAGIDGAVGGDTVMISPGDYHEHGITFQGRAITVRGPDPEDSTAVAGTVADAD